LCDHAAGAGALGFAGRGFETLVKPAFDANLEEAGCISCGQCAQACPTGALTHVQVLEKQVPLPETLAETKCTLCDLSCRLLEAKHGALTTRTVLHPEDLPLFRKGKEIKKCAFPVSPGSNP
jgi:predicted molibdopterin-dependent oxidoreductase YjgC